MPKLDNTRGPGRWSRLRRFCFSRSGARPARYLGQALLSLLVVAGVVLGAGLLGRDCTDAGWYFQGDHGAFGKPLFLAGTLLVLVVAGLAGGWAAIPGFAPRPSGRLTRQEWLFLAGVLLVGGALRVWDLGAYPDHLDTDTLINAGASSYLMAELGQGRLHAVMSSFAPGNECAFFYFGGLIQQLLGLSVFSMRLPSVLVGTLSLAALYLVGRELFSARLATIATLLATFWPWHIWFCRLNKRASLVPLVVALALYFLARGLRAEPGRRAWIPLALCGAMLGLGLNTYELLRVFPLVIAGCLLWVCFRQGRLLWQGLGRLALVAAVATLVASPVLLFALRHPEIYFYHITGQVAGGATGPLEMLANIPRMLRYFLVDLTFEIVETPRLAATLIAVPLLGIFGAVGLALGGRRPGPVGPGRLLVFATFVGLFLPLLLAQTDAYRGRRYIGLMVPFFLLCGGGALGLLRVLGAGIGWRAARVVASVVLVGLVAPMGVLARGWTGHPTNCGVVAQESFFRWALDFGRGRDLYLSPSLFRGNWLSMILDDQPHIKHLPNHFPLPPGELKPGRPLALVSDTASWWPRWAPMLGARQQALSIPAGEGRRQTVHLLHADPRRVAALRIPPAEAARGFSGYWMAPASARYRFSWPPASGAALLIDGRRLNQVADRGAVSVAGGLHRLLYRPGPKPTALTWARIGAREKDPSAAGGLWRLPWGTYLPRVPPVVMVGARKAAEVAVGQMPADSEVPEYVDEFLDLAGHGGKIYVASVGRQLVRRVLVGKKLRLEPLLGSAGGGAYDHAGGGSVEYLLPGYRLGDLSLAVSGAGFFVLDRRQGKILRFGPDGRPRGVLQGPWTAPSDLDATRDGLYVADPGRGQVLLVDPAGGRQPRVLASGVDPVSLAVRERHLAYLDRRLQQLAIRGLGPGQGSETRVQLRAVRRSTRVAAGPDGVLAVCDPVDYSVFLFTAKGRLLAVDGVPRLMSGEFGGRDLGSRPVAALLRGDDLVVMASDGQAYLMELDLEAAIRAASGRP